VPGMNVSARLAAGPALNGVILPIGAVVWWRERRWAYLRIAADRFKRQPVREGLRVPEGWFVRWGFAPGQRIAVKGTELLLSKEFQSLIRGGD
jgi:membrane fusion protein, multidrug efflux system